jgi:hypothetical protein
MVSLYLFSQFLFLSSFPNTAPYRNLVQFDKWQHKYKQNEFCHPEFDEALFNLENGILER